MARRKQSWNIGDIFTVQIKDQRFVLGQIVGREAEVLNSVSVAFYDLRCDAIQEAQDISSLDLEKIFSILFVTRESLDSGDWQIVGSCAINIPKEWMPYEHLRSKRFVGAKVIGSGIIDEFLNAYYALVPWDDWKDPQYLDRLLLSVDKKPSRLLFKS
jgi:hypothetical protein